MITEIIMPKLGQTMEEGTIAKWIKKEGDRVERGDILLEVTTDKATLEVESYSSGVLRKIVAREGKTVPVIEVIGYIAESMEEEIPEKSKNEKLKVEDEEEIKTQAQIEEPEDHLGKIDSKIKISPLARKLAQERGIDITKVKGSGPGGRIVKEDILKVKAGGKVIPLKGMRKVIAERTARSKVIAPHYYVKAEVDMSKAEEIHKTIRVSYNSMIIKAVALSLEGFPLVNASLEREEIKLHQDINIGFLVALEEGLLIPVIKEANKKSIKEIDKEAKDLALRARDNKLASGEGEVIGSTFTVSNLGMYDIESFTAIINQPESGILAVGRKKEKPIVEKGEIVVKPVLSLTLSVDHRVVDGALAAKFLQKIKQILEKGELK